jgi:hypothetical protein
MEPPEIGDRPTTADDWLPYLRAYSEWYIAGEGPMALGLLSERQRAERWLGSEPATPEQVDAAESRLGVVLPPSLRALYLASNGVNAVAEWVEELVPCEELDWFRETHPEWVEDEPTDEWETMLASALTLTDGEDAWLLMTSRPTGGGEFACYHLEVKYGEFSDEHPSFVELVRSGARQIAEGREG